MVDLWGMSGRKFHCTPLQIERALSIFRELTTTTRVNRVTASGSNNYKEATCHIQ